MLSLRKLLLLLLTVITLAMVLLLVIYFTRNTGCKTSLESQSKNIGLRISDKYKWQEYIDAMGNCKNGSFSIYEGTGSGPFLARVILYRISDQEQTSRVQTRDGLVLYTYSIGYDKEKREANVMINFPEVNNLDEAGVSNAIFLVSYKMFTSESYRERNDRFVKFVSPAAMGLIYEKL